jgi:hypothetical protein
MDQGNLDDAAYRQAIGLNPAHVEAHCNLGNALKELGNLEGAVAPPGNQHPAGLCGSLRPSRQ